MKNAVGFVSVLVWAVVITPLICQVFSETEGWDWKRTLIALIGGPPAFAIGNAIAEMMARSERKPTAVDNDKSVLDSQGDDQESK